MTDEDYEEMEQAERKKHDDKLKEIADERKFLEQKAEKWCVENMDCCKSENMTNDEINYFSTEERAVTKSAYKDGYKQGQKDDVYIANLTSRIIDLEQENGELKAQIEKMRNCPNCNKKGCNLEISKRKECIDNNNSLWEWELAE